MKRLLAYILAGLLSYLVFIVILFPASYARHLLQDEMAQHFPEWQLGDVQGTVWRGEVGQLAYQQHALGSLRWRLSAWGLIRGQMRGDALLQNEQGYVHGQFRVSAKPWELYLGELEGRIPIQQLARIVSVFPVGVGGMLSLHLPELALGADGVASHVSGVVVWHQASLHLQQELLLGDLSAHLYSGEEGLLKAEIRDSGGPLLIEAEWQMDRNGQYRLQGYLAATDQASDGLRQSLGWIGTPDPQGRYHLQFDGGIASR